VASMKSDLRNLVTAQEAFFSDNQNYAGGTKYIGDGTVYKQTGTGGVGSTLAFTPSANNIIDVIYIDAAGWKATSTNPAVPLTSTPNTCGVYVGPAANSPNGAVKAEGAPACW
jgi:hypothetical protein